MNTTKNTESAISNEAPISISAVLPMYNDEFTIGPAVTKLVSVFEKLGADYEIILVNDGSPDRAGEVAEKLACSNKKIIVIHHKTNLGYGTALRDGFDTATKKFIFFTDGDGQYEMEDLCLAWPKMKKYKAVLGYPKRRADGFKRIFVSKVYNAICRLYLGSTVKSINCSFKIIEREFFENNKLYSKGGFIDAEIVSRLPGSGFETTEIPVTHYARTHGNSSFLRISNILNILSEMIEFKRTYFDKQKFEDKYF